MKSKLEMYALAVCFASVVCLVISFGVAGYAVFKIAAPEISMNKYVYDRFQTNEAFDKYNRLSSDSDKQYSVEKPRHPDRAELQQLHLQEEVVLERHQNQILKLMERQHEKKLLALFFWR